ncbi:MAG TPA: hypothetical protein VLB44_23660 [Kofleriaceae bacterium]|nr:hypothetical protein [Kofleriaceae bacterium]
MLGTGPVFADNLDFYGTANGSVATTDNATGAEQGRPHQGDIFSDVRPGFLITYNAPRMIHELNSEVDFLYHVLTTQPNVTFRGGWKAYFLPSPLTELTVNADASMGQLNALSASISPSEDPTQVLPPGRVDVKNITGGQNFAWVLSEGTRTWERSFGRYATTLDEVPMMENVSTESSEVGGSLGIEHTFKHDNFMLEGGLSFVHMLKLDPAGRQMGSRLDQQWNPRAVVVWQHDINKQWSTNLDAGGVYVIPVGTDPYNPDQKRTSAPYPIFGLTTAYTDVWGRAQLAVRRQVTPNLFIAQNTVGDSINLTGVMPLELLDKDSQKQHPKVIGIGTIGFERTQLVDPISGSLKGQFEVARIDLGVGWSPRPGQTLGLRYELTYQTGDDVAEMVVPAFLRNTFYFTFALRYPEDLRVRVPRRGQSVRADKKDLSPVGAEPVIVDPQEFLDGGDR